MLTSHERSCPAYEGRGSYRNTFLTAISDPAFVFLLVGVLVVVATITGYAGMTWLALGFLGGYSLAGST